MSIASSGIGTNSLFGYDVLSQLGEGAGSRIYAVCDPKTGQLYALKHVLRKSDKDGRFIEQLQNEFEVSRPFRHPVLRKCVDLKVNKRLLGGPSEAALVMELVDGVTLEQQPQLPVPTLIDVLMQTAQGLAAMHHLRLVHCDLNPGNIFLCADGRVKLIDFAQSSRTGAIQHRVQDTAYFLAPEQVRGKAVDPTTDVFNFGATLYWALTGRRIPTPFNGSKAQWRELEEQQYPTPLELNPAAPEPLSKLAMWCCKVSPGSRPPDMAMVVVGLKKISQTLQPA